MSLFTLFSRPRVERARGHRDYDLPPVSYKLRSPPQPVEVPPPPPPKSTTSFTRMPEPASNTLRTREIGASHQGSVSRRTRKTAAHWEPPPLFQAYPQAVKHARLQASHLSAEGILKEQRHRRQYSMLQEKLESKLDLHTLRSDNQDEGAIDMQSVRNGDKASQIRLSINYESPPVDLPTKLYILVTSGCLLQYAGEGPSDRLPEKILQLGKDSAAFASDLIPGRHWVLQISQAANEDGTATVNHPRSLLAKLRFGNQTARRAVTSFLLVMEGPEEMESWLTAVRKQIELLGGMKCNSEPGSRPLTADSKEQKLHEKPSHRYLVQRDPNRMDKEKSLVPLPVDAATSVAGPDWNGNTARFSAIVSDATSLKSRQASVRQSTDAPSVSTTTVSNEQVQLNNLRESSRLSIMSSATSGTGTITIATSRASSAPTSPVTDAFASSDRDQVRHQSMLRPFHINTETVSANRRRSVQPLPTTDENTSQSVSAKPQRPLRLSTYGTVGSTAQPQGESDSRQAAPHLGRFPIAVNPSSTASLASVRSSSAPNINRPRYSPPAMPDRSSLRPESTVGDLPTSTRFYSHGQTSSPRLGTPGFRPIPIRTYEPTIPRRMSSLPPGPLASSNRLSSMPAPSSAQSASSQPTQHSPPSPSQVCARQPAAQALRRPTSMQIRSDPAPFLSSSRLVPASYKAPNTLAPSINPPSPETYLTRPHPYAKSNAVEAGISYNPTSATATASSSVSTSSSVTTTAVVPPPTYPSKAALAASKPKMKTRQSLPTIRLPPPRPPPNMPLPTLPPPDMPLPPVPRPVAV